MWHSTHIPVFFSLFPHLLFFPSIDPPHHHHHLPRNLSILSYSKWAFFKIILPNFLVTFWATLQSTLPLFHASVIPAFTPIGFTSSFEARLFLQIKSRDHWSWWMCLGCRTTRVYDATFSFFTIPPSSHQNPLILLLWHLSRQSHELWCVDSSAKVRHISH